VVISISGMRMTIPIVADQRIARSTTDLNPSTLPMPNLLTQIPQAPY